jgi:hypothetical protein
MNSYPLNCEDWESLRLLIEDNKVKLTFLINFSGGSGRYRDKEKAGSSRLLSELQQLSVRRQNQENSEAGRGIEIIETNRRKNIFLHKIKSMT